MAWRGTQTDGSGTGNGRRVSDRFWSGQQPRDGRNGRRHNEIVIEGPRNPFGHRRGKGPGQGSVQREPEAHQHGRRCCARRRSAHPTLPRAPAPAPSPTPVPTPSRSDNRGGGVRERRGENTRRRTWEGHPGRGRVPDHQPKCSAGSMGFLRPEYWEYPRERATKSGVPQPQALTDNRHAEERVNYEPERVPIAPQPYEQDRRRTGVEKAPQGGPRHGAFHSP